MQIGVMTVTTAAQRVPVSTAVPLTNGVRLLCRTANTGNVYVGTDNTVTTATGNLLPQGAPGTTNVYTAATDKPLWLIGDGSGQVVDWSAN